MRRLLTNYHILYADNSFSMRHPEMEKLSRNLKTKNLNLSVFPPSVCDWETVGWSVVGEGGDTSRAAEDSSEAEGSVQAVQAVQAGQLSWLVSVGRGSVAGSGRRAAGWDRRSPSPGEGGSSGNRSKHRSLQAEPETDRTLSHLASGQVREGRMEGFISFHWQSLTRHETFLYVQYLEFEIKS